MEEESTTLTKKKHQRMSDISFILGWTYIALAAGVFTASIGTYHEAYCFCEEEAILGIGMIMFPFVAGYLSGRFYVRR